MQSLILIAALTLPSAPVPSQPCETVPLPSGGTMCAPKLTQRVDVAPKMVKLGDTIRTQYETNARRLCHSWGGNWLIAVPNTPRAWDCFYRKVKP